MIKLHLVCDEAVLTNLATSTEELTQHSTMATSLSPTSSSRLLNLPPELRNRIHDLAFTTDADTEIDIDLLTASGPSKALVLTRHHVYSEAAGLHKRAYRRYWTSGNFTMAMVKDAAVQRPPPNGIAPNIQALDDEDIQHIINLSITIVCKEYSSGQLSMIQVPGKSCVGWIQTKGGTHYQPRVLLVTEEGSRSGLRCGLEAFSNLE